MTLTVSALETQFRRRAILLAYRHLYRTGLRTIRFARPARYVLRGILRSAFRSGSPEGFEPQRIVNTLQFLQRASEATTTEHKIVKTIIHVRFWQQPQMRKEKKLFDPMKRPDADTLSSAYMPFDMTLNMLNESLGLCLR